MIFVVVVIYDFYALDNIISIGVPMNVCLDQYSLSDTFTEIWSTSLKRIEVSIDTSDPSSEIWYGIWYADMRWYMVVDDFELAKPLNSVCRSDISPTVSLT